MDTRYAERKAKAVMHDGQEPFFIFAYGSLIWRPDFNYTACYQAWVSGYERRFWQASHDHRGTPSRPGRVVTLVPVSSGRCEGVLYQLPEKGRDEILGKLDAREQDGYERTWLQGNISDGKAEVPALTWLAAEGNPSWAGQETLSELAQVIASRHGPSGSNREYLLRLHEAFIQMDIKDQHIAALVEEVEQICRQSG